MTSRVAFTCCLYALVYCVTLTSSASGSTYQNASIPKNKNSTQESTINSLPADSESPHPNSLLDTSSDYISSPISISDEGDGAKALTGVFLEKSCIASFSTGESFNLKLAENPSGHYRAYSSGFTYMFQICGNMKFLNQKEAPKCGFTSGSGTDCPASCDGKICGEGCAAIQVSNSTSSYFNYCYAAGQIVDSKTEKSEIVVSLIKDQSTRGTVGVQYSMKNGDADYCDTGSREMSVQVLCPTLDHPASSQPSKVTAPKDSYVNKMKT